jgi:sigma-B regulation protein RsbU (phosphoserine phosphatase)
MNDLVGRLGIQIGSLQEGFELLAKASNLKDLARQFFHILRGNFVTTHVGLYHKPDPGAAWQKLQGDGAERFEQNATVPLGETFSIQILDDPEVKVQIVQPLIDKSFLGILLGEKLDKTGYSDLDRISLQIYAQLFDNAHQALLHRKKEKELIFSLNHRVLQLNSLIDTGIEVSKLDQHTSVQRLALERAAALTNASGGLLRIAREGKSEEFRFPEGVSQPPSTENGHSITSSFEFSGSTYTFALFAKESRKGLLPFEETDQILLDALARQVHASLENRYLHKQALEKQKIEQDIEVAASIQQKILPDALPSIEGYDVFGINIPSKSVGGDYYDCIPLKDGRYALVIADVAGKGVPAALLVSSLHAYLSAYLEGGFTLTELVHRLNKVIHNASTDDKFITAFIALLTPKTGDIESTSAGHNEIYLLKNDGSIQDLKAGGLPLGMVDLDLPYESEKARVEPGERLLLYTDGVPEATDEQNRLFESAVPLREFVEHNRPERAERFIQELIEKIKRFTGSAPQSDDITALYLLRC